VTFKPLLLRSLVHVFAFLLMGLLWSGCYRQDVQTVAIDVPEMTDPDCEINIQRWMGSRNGVEAVKVDLVNHAVVVTYNAREIELRNLEHNLVDLGYDVLSAAPAADGTPYVIKAPIVNKYRLPPSVRPKNLPPLPPRKPAGTPPGPK
jgi:copper chaperone CopZ